LQTLTKISHGSARKPVSCAESIVAGCERHDGSGRAFHDGGRCCNRNGFQRSRKFRSGEMERLAQSSSASRGRLYRYVQPASPGAAGHYSREVQQGSPEASAAYNEASTGTRRRTMRLGACSRLWYQRVQAAFGEDQSQSNPAENRVRRGPAACCSPQPRRFSFIQSKRGICSLFWP
jgi:hypothetical protein